MVLAYLLLLLLVAALAIYDWQTERLPNGVTLLLLASGLLIHWPGAPATWLGCLLLFSAWQLGGLGGGDAKLWMALLWLTPFERAGQAFVVFAAAMTLTALVQLLWRKFRRKTTIGVSSPGAWRALPFVLWLLVAA
jgi:Flp pilus assembly protein protease CpaA